MAAAALADVVEIVMGQAPPGDACNKDGVGTPFVKAGEFQDRRPVIREWTTMPLRMAQYDDTLVCVVGATAGKVNQGADCAIGRSVAAVRPRKDTIDPEFLYRFLSTTVARLRGGSQGAAQGVITREMIGSLALDLPPLPEQRRIAAILDHADALRAKRRQVLAHLDALTQSIFNDMFGSEIWDSTLSDIADIQIGPFGSLLHKEDYVSGGVPVINPMHIRDGQLQPDSEFSVAEQKAASLSLYRLREGDVVLGRRGEMGRAGVAGAQHVGMLCGTGSLILRPRGVDSQYLHSVVTSPRMKAHLERNSLGATLPNLNATIVKRSPAPKARDFVQAKFAERLRAVQENLITAHRATRSDDELFASIQSRAFRGEL